MNSKNCSTSFLTQSTSVPKSSYNFIDKELSEQLGIMCEKSGISIKRLKGSENIEMINTAAQLQELYYVEPLLMAYQHKNALLDSEIKQMKEDANGFQQYAADLVKQNDFLRKELKRKGEYILKSEQVGINVNFIKLDNEALNQKNKLLNEKSEFLTDKVKDLSKALDTLQKKQNNTQELSRLEKQLEAEKEKSKQLEIGLIDVKSKLEIVTNQLNNEKTINREFERKQSELENEVSKFRNEAKILQQQVESLELNGQHQKETSVSEIQTLKGQLSASQRRETELFNKNMLMEGEVNEKSSKLHNLSLANTELQTNNNNILQMLEAYESKNTALTKKIKSLESHSKETRDESSGQRKELQILRWKLSEKQKEQERKDQQSRKERDRLNKMWEERIDVMRRAFEDEKDRIYDDLKSDNFQNRASSIKP